MYDVDIHTLMEAITPPKQKLEKHGIESVRQRVVNLKELGLKLSVEELRNHIAHSLCDGEKVLADDEVNEIQIIEQGYYTPDFLKSK
jgi:lipoic acid synthetase/lipoate-protein ligase A